jgi:REP element-mobilizing transposase RayT
MERYWLLTSTFYGNWLPGDPRGFVSRVRETRPEDLPAESRVEHDTPGTPYDADLPGLHRYARQQLRGAPIRIHPDQAQVPLNQFQETATYRGWLLLAVAVLANHVHLVVGVNGEPSPTKVLGDFKAYGSRALTRQWGKPPGDTWWTYDGSKRKLASEQALRAAIAYVRSQHQPLVVWVAPEFSGR